MKNVTLKLDEDLLNRVRHVAVDQDTSLSAWVANLIESALRERDSYEEVRSAALEDLGNPLHLGGKPLGREELHEH